MFATSRAAARHSSVHGILQVRILEWVAILFSKGSSPPRDQTGVSCLAGRFFTLGAIRTDCGQKAKSGKFKVVKSCSSCSGQRQRQSAGEGGSAGSKRWFKKEITSFSRMRFRDL